MQEVTIGLAFIAGLLSFVSPCVLPLVPAYVGYMGGRMTRTVATTRKRNETDDTPTLGKRLSTVVHSLAFILGFTFVFVSIGIATTAFVQIVGSSVNAITLILARVGGVIIILFGLHYMGTLRWLFQQAKDHKDWLNIGTSLAAAALLSIFILWSFVELIYALPVLAAVLLTLALNGAFSEPKKFWLNTLDSLQSALYTDTRRDIDPNKATSLTGSFFMGMVFSAGWTPCIGPIYGGILNMSLQGGSIALAGLLLATYSLGLGIPFLLTALMLDAAQTIIRRLQKYMHTIEIISGVILISIGVLVATGTLQNLSQNLSPAQTEFSIRIEECGTEFFAGDIALQHVGTCIDGNLHPVAFNQSVSIQWTETTPPQQVVFTMDESRAVDVQLLSVDAEPTSIDVQLLDDSGSTIDSSNSLESLGDNAYRALDNIALDAGRYRLIIDASFPEELRARVKVAPADISRDNAADTTEGSAAEDLVRTAQTETPAAEIGLEEGKIAPDFTVTTIEGDEISLYDLRGQVVLINFWGTWCGPCLREMPELQATYENHGDNNFEIIALAGAPDDRDDVIEFRDEFGITFPLAVDEGDTVTDRYGITNQPSTFIIDESGEIIFRWFGIVNQEQLDEILNRQIAEPADSDINEVESSSSDGS